MIVDARPGRLVRLIPDDPDHDDSEKAAIKTFFNHRLPKERTLAREEWQQIIEAEHALWSNISTAKKELVRSMLNVVAYEIVKRRRPSSSFDFSGASIGNLFLTGYVFIAWRLRILCTSATTESLLTTLTSTALGSLPDLSNLPSTFSPVFVPFPATLQFSLQSTPTSPTISPSALRMATSSLVRTLYHIHQSQRLWNSLAHRPKSMRRNSTTVLKMPIYQAHYLHFASSISPSQKPTRKSYQRESRGYGTSTLMAKRFGYPRIQWCLMH